VRDANHPPVAMAAALAAWIPAFGGLLGAAQTAADLGSVADYCSSADHCPLQFVRSMAMARRLLRHRREIGLRRSH